MLAIYISMLDTNLEKDKMTEIYERYKFTFFKIALNLTNDKQMAEDAVHNSFIAIIDQKEKYFNLDGSEFLFSSVLIVRNKSIDLIRKEKRYVDIPIDELEIYLEPSEPSVEEQIELKSKYELLWRQLDRLDELNKQILLLKYEGRLTYKEIGQALGLTESHVQTKIYRAKEKLRRFYESEGDVE